MPHYEMPVHLVTTYNGFKSRQVVDYFVRYCKVLFERFHDKVTYWIVFNQINSSGGWGEFSSLGLLDGYTLSDTYEAVHHQFIASALAKKVAVEIDPSLRIGLMTGDNTKYPATCDPHDILASTQSNQMNVYFYSDVFLRGEYPGYALRYFYDNHINFKPKEKDLTLLREYKADF